MSHSIRGASGAHRWMKCPGCINQTEALPKHARSGTSSYAEEGTTAHAVAEWALQGYVEEGAILDARELVGLARLTTSDGVHLFKKPGPDTPRSLRVTDEMVDAVDIFLDWVRGKLKEMPGAEMLIEVSVNLSWLGRDDLWGTLDLALVDRIMGQLVVADYKHGAGTPVEVEGNAQMLYYGLGPLNDQGPQNFTDVELNVVQPRCPHPDGPIRPWKVSPPFMLAWGQTMKEAADLTDDPNAPLHPGDWCKFCEAKGVCTELRAKVQGELALSFDDYPVGEIPGDALPIPTIEDPDKVARALAALPLIDTWCKGVAGVAQQILEAGTDLPGFKLVRKKSNRKWKGSESDLARKAARRPGVSTKDVYKERVLKTPAQLEKVKGVGKEWVAKWSEKPPGGHTVAPESDARKAVVIERLEFPALPEGEGEKDPLF